MMKHFYPDYSGVFQNNPTHESWGQHENKKKIAFYIFTINKIQTHWTPIQDFRQDMLNSASQWQNLGLSGGGAAPIPLL